MPQNIANITTMLVESIYQYITMKQWTLPKFEDNLAEYM